jgi:hypothetical protein
VLLSLQTAPVLNFSRACFPAASNWQYQICRHGIQYVLPCTLGRSPGCEHCTQQESEASTVSQWRIKGGTAELREVRQYLAGLEAVLCVFSTQTVHRQFTLCVLTNYLHTTVNTSWDVMDHLQTSLPSIPHHPSPFPTIHFLILPTTTPCQPLATQY